jgi:hypothetical protein
MSVIATFETLKEIATCDGNDHRKLIFALASEREKIIDIMMSSPTLSSVVQKGLLSSLIITE